MHVLKRDFFNATVNAKLWVILLALCVFYTGTITVWAHIYYATWRWAQKGTRTVGWRVGGLKGSLFMTLFMNYDPDFFVLPSKQQGHVGPAARLSGF